MHLLGSLSISSSCVWRRHFTAGLVGTVLLTLISTPAQSVEPGDIPALKGLEFSDVVIHTIIGVQTNDGKRDSDRLRVHAINRLREHKLVGIVADGQPTQAKGNPKMIITLFGKKIPECPDMFLYARRLELRESAVREREPKVVVEGISFGGGNVLSDVINVREATVERFEKDLDWMIDSFARSYWDWNK